jgi:RsiW-degrading membrane proteinase PrsW (M82 family)
MLLTMDFGDAFTVLALATLTAYVVLVFLVAWVAQQRGQNGPLWFLLAVFASPIIAALLLLIITSPRRTE